MQRRALAGRNIGTVGLAHSIDDHQWGFPMTNNPTVEVQKYGQSLWYDNLSRDMIQSGELRMLIDDYGVLGMTSNPTIFEKAIGEGKLYDDTIMETFDLEVNEAFDKLAIEDIRQAADLLRPIFDRTKGNDGYISLEVSP